jgi:hypothetical protein
VFGCGGFVNSSSAEDSSDHADDHDSRALTQTPEFKRLHPEREELLHRLFEITDQNDNKSFDTDELRKNNAQR